MLLNNQIRGLRLRKDNGKLQLGTTISPDKRLLSGTAIPVGAWQTVAVLLSNPPGSTSDDTVSNEQNTD